MGQRSPLGTLWSDTLSPDQLRVLVIILEKQHFEGRQPSYEELALSLSGNGRSHHWVEQIITKLTVWGLIEKNKKKQTSRARKINCRIEFFPEFGLKGKTNA